MPPSSSSSRQHHNQQHHDWEFFGPYGPAVLVVALPCVVLGLSFACNPHGCLSLPSLALPGLHPSQPLYTHEAMAAMVGWFFLVLGLHVLLPADTVEGVLLPNGRRLTYRLNGEFGGRMPCCCCCSCCCFCRAPNLKLTTARC
jgi:hypothetical protein